MAKDMDSGDVGLLPDASAQAVAVMKLRDRRKHRRVVRTENGSYRRNRGELNYAIQVRHGEWLDAVVAISFD